MARRFRLAAGLTCLWLSPAVAAAQSPAPLSLADAVAEALAKNERIVNQADLIAQADLGLRLARNTFRPKVTPNIFGSFGGNDLNNQTYRVDLSQRLVTGTELRVSTGTATAQIPAQDPLTGTDVQFYNADTTLTLSQPLLRGFGRSVTRRSLTAAELRREDAARLQTMAEQQVAVDVAAAYYRVVSQQSLAAVARQSLLRARRLRDASEAKLDAGLVSQLDSLRSQQLVSQAEMQVFDAQSAVEDARDQLTFLLGRRDAAFAIEAIIPRPVLDPIDVAAATGVALANRLDLKSRIASSADADNEIRFTKNQLLPQVDVNFAVTRRETSPTFRDSFALDGYRFATFFAISMPVDRTARQVEYQAALIDRDRRKRDTETLERKITDDVKQAVRERDRTIRQLAAAESGVELSRREVDVAQLRYENGLSNNLDVVTAEAGLLQAESRRIQALADSAVATLRLRAVLGIFNPRTDMTGAASLAAVVSPHAPLHPVQ